ncbi:MAG: 2-aminoethylphosphonate--pyruvate transaminase [Alphaproteobacteria bacterium]|nr:2-aminoethylphosphonate--pyruvate transaminase [Alphaproteobacteria bacterium]
MTSSEQVSFAKDKTLFTPGPLTTSQSVKQAMLRDLGSRDTDFIQTVRQIRRILLDVAGVPGADVAGDHGYEVVLMQGSGTFGLESVIGSTVPMDGKLLVIINGAYGDRVANIARVLKIETTTLEYSSNVAPSAADVDRVLTEDKAITNVFVVHCETTSGIMNPIEQIGAVVARHRKTYFVDSMSAFGAVPFDFEKCKIDFLVSSANKCIEGVPGFSFVICRRSSLLAAEGCARSVSLDLLAQWRGLETNGQFRFTPPTHSILAFEQALCELVAEGGVDGRATRYRANNQTLLLGMREIGFAEYLLREQQGVIITAFCYPDHPRFLFDDFYRRLNEKGFVIYPGKVSNIDCFRIGNIGRLFRSDILALLAAVRSTLEEMGVTLA